MVAEAQRKAAFLFLTCSTRPAPTLTRSTGTSPRPTIAFMAVLKEVAAEVISPSSPRLVVGTIDLKAVKRQRKVKESQ